MPAWPISPVATMQARQDQFLDVSASISFSETIPNTQTLVPGEVTWTVSINFRETGTAKFKAALYQQPAGGNEILVDSTEATLGHDPSVPGNWSDALIVRTTPTAAIEVFVLELYCETVTYSTSTSAGPARRSFTVLQAVPPKNWFALDYIPLSIVYCPPNQDMSASLQNSQEYGTRLTMGTREDLVGVLNARLKSDLGLIITGISDLTSQSVENHSSAAVEISYFQNTVITADNQRAIGRAYWGPLGDLFVIAANLQFALVATDPGKFIYYPLGVEDLILVPAYKLLRPGDDSTVARIPTNARRKILELDPFITNLDLFFPDSGAALELAANPYADPSDGNRAERIGRWCLSTGTELNYSMGIRKELKTGESSQLKFWVFGGICG